MAGEWPQVILDDLTETPITYGVVKPGAEDPGGVLFIRGGDVANGRINIEALRTITREVSKQYKRTVLRGGELIVSLVGRPGQVAIVPLSLTGANIARQVGLVRLSGEVDARFVKYFLQSPLGQNALGAHSLGSVQQVINLRDLKTVRVPQPPLREQQAIACILGALDDKIDLNQRMNQTVETMARAIFKSWFVDFLPVRAKIAARTQTGDPVRAKATGQQPPGLTSVIADLFPDAFVESEMGEIPAGWSAVRLGGFLAEIVSGARPRGGAVGEGIPSIGAENVLGLGKYDFTREKYVPRDFYEQLKAKRAAVRSADVLLYKDGAKIGRKTYFDRTFPHSECAINEHVFILRTYSARMQRFLFFWLELPWMTNEIITLNSNSAQPGINKAGVRELPFLLPAEAVVEAFDDLVAPMTDGLFERCHECRTLGHLRDGLLPKLISGELPVPDAERIFGRVV